MFDRNINNLLRASSDWMFAGIQMHEHMSVYTGNKTWRQPGKFMSRAKTHMFTYTIL